MLATAMRKMTPGERRRGDLAGEVALVTGASRGLGLLLARELGRHCGRLVICARDAGELEPRQRERCPARRPAR